MGLTPRQQRFVEEYLIDLNATQAAIRAGYSSKTAGQQGERLLKNVEIKAAVDDAISERSERTKVTSAKVLERLWSIATVDPNELVEHRRTCCRHCHGANGEYQRTQRERDRDFARWESSTDPNKPAAFDE